MEPVDVKVTIKDVEYTVTITHIGEVIERPDGSGDLPIEYHTMPECPEDDQDELYDALSNLVSRAIQEAIEEAKCKQRDEEE